MQSVREMPDRAPDEHVAHIVIGEQPFGAILKADFDPLAVVQQEPKMCRESILTAERIVAEGAQHYHSINPMLPKHYGG